MNRHQRTVVTVMNKRMSAFRAMFLVETHKLTRDRIEMIAAGVYSRTREARLFDKLVAELVATAEARKAREARQ